MKVYFKGGYGIENPIDYNGNPIKEGDILTSDCFDDFFNQEFYKKNYPDWTDEDIKVMKHSPTYKVKWNPKGFFYGVGIERNLYLHDFRFKFTKIIEKI